ncbi:DEAD/DEAH box helicase [Flavobacterium aciduliphilum]|uniref:Superfamily II DNA or RNA helicase n=1 Tax=Flavobacterium aciduliphilum TaxID=1101402 RepID=A0A328YT47_9FLAO|nr:DEAD/DEAH box helicase family protein [Flavobacterium aciduliphilum]RAR73707.1 superfamily II DNA or RNA helicase [Flavobacterium aciduliphilum]
MIYNHDEIIASLSIMFEKLNDQTRKKLLGEEIERIINSYFGRISADQLATSLLSKYGSDLFNKKYGVFETIINGSEREDLISLAISLGLNTDSKTIWDDILCKLDSKRNLSIFLKNYNLPDYFLMIGKKDLRETTETIKLEYNQSLTSLGFPHSYQNFVKLELIEKINNSSGKFSSLVVMPTGSGKTRTAVEYMIDFIREKKKANIIWVVDSPELAEQALQTFKSLWLLRGDRELTIHRCFNKFNPTINFEKKINIIFCAFDKLRSEKEKTSNLFNGLKLNTNLLLIDEAHYSLATKYDEILSSIKNNSKELITIGLTATPLRPDDNEMFSLKNYFDNRIIEFKDEDDIIIKNPLEYLQEKNYLASIDVEYLSIPSDEIKPTSSEFNTKIINRIKQSLEEKKQIIIFAMSKNHAIALDILLKHEKVKCNCIIGETLSQERQIYFKEFQDKKINVLINYDILATGIDLPKVDELFILRKFGQVTTAMQVLGRALRGELNGGNKKNKIISVINNKVIINNPNDLYNLINNMHT